MNVSVITICFIFFHFVSQSVCNFGKEEEDQNKEIQPKQPIESTMRRSKSFVPSSSKLSKVQIRSPSPPPSSNNEIKDPNRKYKMPPASYFDQKSQQDTFRAAECLGQAANCLIRFPAHGIGQIARETIRGTKAYIEQDYKKVGLHGLKVLNSAICSGTACLAYTIHHTNQAINHASSAIGHGFIKQFAEYNDSNFTKKQDQKRQLIHKKSLEKQNSFHYDKVRQQRLNQLKRSKSFYDHI